MVSSVTPRVDPSRVWSTNSASSGDESWVGVVPSVDGTSVAGAAAVLGAASVSGGACVSDGAAVSPGGAVVASSELPDVQLTRITAAKPAAINFFTESPSRCGRSPASARAMYTPSPSLDSANRIWILTKFERVYKLLSGRE